MTFSAEQYRENIGKNEALPARARAYFQQRFQQQVFARIAKAFADRSEEFGVTKSCLATLTNKDKAQINRVLAHPTNLTLDSVSDILFALNYEPNLIADDLSEPTLHNYCHPAYINLPTDGFRQIGFRDPEIPLPRVRIRSDSAWQLEATE